MGKSPLDLGLPILVCGKGGPFIYIGGMPVRLKERAEHAVRPWISLDAGYHHGVWHKDRKPKPFESIRI
jgi:hypothetical protein